MCYMGCQYERYPDGPNEDCRCTRRGKPCPMEEADGDRDREPELELEQETETENETEESQHEIQ